MKPRDYCCCAIPIVNAGIYAVLTEQLVLAILIGTLSISTPSIVGAATPSFAKWILAIICYVAAAIQVLGFVGVAQERTILYRRYVTLHAMITTAAFAVAAAWVIMSATRHSTAQTNCLNTFFGGNDNTPTTSEAQTLCNIFPWADVGIMGGAWVLFAISQFYFYVVVSSYGTSQQRDHEKRDSMYDVTNPLTSDIPMTNRSDPWDSRPSTDSLAANNEYLHTRNLSNATVTGEAPVTYPPYRQMSTRSRVAEPVHAYTQDPGPTPEFNDSYYSGGAAGISKPANTQAHPAEGSFRRKTPRLQKTKLMDYDTSF